MGQRRGSGSPRDETESCYVKRQTLNESYSVPALDCLLRYQLGMRLIPALLKSSSHRGVEADELHGEGCWR